jgi:hypothetical protein
VWTSYEQEHHKQGKGISKKVCPEVSHKNVLIKQLPPADLFRAYALKKTRAV